MDSSLLLSVTLPLGEYFVFDHSLTFIFSGRRLEIRRRSAALTDAKDPEGGVDAGDLAVLKIHLFFGTNGSCCLEHIKNIGHD